MGRIVENDRFPIVGHPANNPRSQFPVENQHLFFVRLQQPNFDIGSVMIDPKDQCCLGMHRRRNQLENLGIEFFVLKRRVNNSGRL